MSLEPNFPDEELAACARRELAQRKRVYPRLVSKGKMDQGTAELEIAMMKQNAEYFENKTQPKLL
jgi:hypothetical protein